MSNALPLTITTDFGTLYTNGNTIFAVTIADGVATAASLDPATGRINFNGVLNVPSDHVANYWAPYLNDGSEPVFPASSIAPFAVPDAQFTHADFLPNSEGEPLNQPPFDMGTPPEPTPE